MAAIYDTTFGIKTARITPQAEELLCEVIRDECENMVRIQHAIFEFTIDHFAAQNKTITGSYLHLPTLFFAEHLSDVKEKAVELGCTVYEETAPLDRIIPQALNKYYKSMESA